VRGIKGRGDITPAMLADRCLELLKRRRPDKRNLLFVIDEVGQFVARDGSKLEDLRAVVERLGQRGAGKIWVMVTSQEALSELVSGLDSTRIELPKVKDRFPLQVHLEPSDISEVTSRRVLAKNAEGETTLRAMYDAHRARLGAHTRVVRAAPQAPRAHRRALHRSLPAPALPDRPDHQHRLRPAHPRRREPHTSAAPTARSSSSPSSSSSTPTLTSPSKPVGTLATIDRVYDLIAGNITSDVRKKIDQIGRDVPHKLAQPVAKAVCLLQYEARIPRTPENIAAALHPSIGADSQLAEVKAALEALVAARAVRLGEDGYRIPTPAEDNWEKERASIAPKPADDARVHQEIITGLWEPQPSHALLGVKPFKAGLLLNSRLLVEGDLKVHVTLASSEKEHEELRESWRQRSRDQKNELFWVARIDHEVRRATDEVFRSAELLARKERTASTRDETTLVAEEKRRKQRAQEDLKRHLREALLSGVVYFRGNDRSPELHAGDIGKAVSGVSGQGAARGLRPLRRGRRQGQPQRPRRLALHREPARPARGVLSAPPRLRDPRQAHIPHRERPLGRGARAHRQQGVVR
jgi:hypothetical protein